MLSAHLANIPENWGGGGGSSEIASLIDYLPHKHEDLSLMTRIHVKSSEWWHAFVISALGTGGFHKAHWPADPSDWQVHSERPCLKNKMTLLRNTSLMHAWMDMHTQYTYIHVPAHKHIYKTRAYMEN